MVQKILFRFCACLLLVTFLLPVIAGCKKEGGEEDTTTGEKEEITTIEDENVVNTADTLGDYDFGGAKYNILARESTVGEFNPNKGDGSDIIKNAIYTRNQSVEERFNVKISIEEIGCWWNNDLSKCPWFAKYGVLTLSGWSEYAMLTGHFSIAQNAAVRGYCMDLTTLDAIDMQKEWWSKQFFEKCNLNGKFYVAVGDIGYGLYEDMWVVYFNKELAQSVLKDDSGNPIDLYRMVDDKEWTWEKLKQYIVCVNDVGVDEADKKYGFAGGRNAMRAFASAFEIEYAKVDKSGGYPMLSFPQSPIARTVDILDEMSRFFNSTAANSSKIGYTNDFDAIKAFTQGRLLFLTERLGEVSEFSKAMGGSPYGVLPYPMYDENQLEYHTDIYDGTSAVTVPRNVKDTEMVGVITEALCMYGYHEIRPVYLDILLGGQYSTDYNMAKMLDLIRESFDIAFFNAYSGAMGTPHVYSATDAILTNNAQNYTSYYASYVSKYTSNLQKFYKAFGINT